MHQCRGAARAAGHLYSLCLGGGCAHGRPHAGALPPRSTGSGASASPGGCRGRVRTISCGRTATCPTGIHDRRTLVLGDARIRLSDLYQRRLSLSQYAPQSGATILRVATCGGSRCPRAWEGQRIVLHFGGVYSACSVFLNDRAVGYFEDSALPSEFDITDLVREGDNRLAVKVLKWCDGSYLEDADHWRMAGIYREVYLPRGPSTGRRGRLRGADPARRGRAMRCCRSAPKSTLCGDAADYGDHTLRAGALRCGRSARGARRAAGAPCGRAARRGLAAVGHALVRGLRGACAVAQVVERRGRPTSIRWC